MDLFTPSDAKALDTLEVDTDAHLRLGVTLDRLGRRLGGKSVLTTEAGYAEFVAWVERFGALDRVGFESSGGLALEGGCGVFGVVADEEAGVVPEPDLVLLDLFSAHAKTKRGQSLEVTRPRNLASRSLRSGTCDLFIPSSGPALLTAYMSGTCMRPGWTCLRCS